MGMMSKVLEDQDNIFPGSMVTKISGKPFQSGLKSAKVESITTMKVGNDIKVGVMLEGCNRPVEMRRIVLV